jgi:hypothetical protein
MEPRSKVIEARRQFLATCGKFAVATPPAVALLLSAAERNYAVASSGYGQPNGQQGQGNNGQNNSCWRNSSVQGNSGWQGSNHHGSNRGR